MIRVGVAGWDYPDWGGIVYPSPAPRGFDRLSFLAGFFDVIEINVTFYRRVDPKTTRSWAHRAPSGGSFTFTAKLYQAFTHAGASRRATKTDTVDLEAEARAYLAGIAPLLESARLGAVLMQFPHAFRDGPDSRRHLARVVELFPGLPLVAEFRHRSWDNERLLSFLRDLGVGFCNIDQPALGSTLPPTEHVTSRVAYIRLHGRNAGAWFARERSREGASGARDTGSARYDYLYSMDELRPWIERARGLSARAEEVFVIANNHYRGKGPANALMVKSALSSGRARAPADLIATHPRLKDMADPVGTTPKPRPSQGRLF